MASMAMMPSAGAIQRRMAACDGEEPGWPPVGVSERLPKVGSGRVAAGARRVTWSFCLPVPWVRWVSGVKSRMRFWTES